MSTLVIVKISQNVVQKICLVVTSFYLDYMLLKSFLPNRFWLITLFSFKLFLTDFSLVFLKIFLSNAVRSLSIHRRCVAKSEFLMVDLFARL